VIAVLRAHEAELRAAGIRGLALFGSVARGEAGADSDIDLAVDLNPDARIGLFAPFSPQRRLAQLVGREVDLLPEPMEKQRLLMNVNPDRRLVF